MSNNALLNEKKIGPKFKDMCFGATAYTNHRVSRISKHVVLSSEYLQPQLCAETEAAIHSSHHNLY